MVGDIAMTPNKTVTGQFSRNVKRILPHTEYLLEKSHFLG